MQMSDEINVAKVRGTMAPELMRAQMAVEYVGTYLALKSQIADLEAQADEARSAVREILYPDGVKAGVKHAFAGLGNVEGVKGRVTEKLDRAKLARAGVAADVLDAATVRTEGEPTMRITAAKEGADANT
jgi:hypothetical protein